MLLGETKTTPPKILSFDNVFWSFVAILIVGKDGQLTANRLRRKGPGAHGQPTRERQRIQDVATCLVSNYYSLHRGILMRDLTFLANASRPVIKDTVVT